MTRNSQSDYDGFTDSEIISAIKAISPNKEIEKILILRIIKQSTWKELGIGRIEKKSFESYVNEVVKYLEVRK